MIDERSIANHTVNCLFKRPRSNENVGKSVVTLEKCSHN